MLLVALSVKDVRSVFIKNFAMIPKYRQDLGVWAPLAGSSRAQRQRQWQFRSVEAR